MSDSLKLDNCEVCAGLGYIEEIDTCCPHCRGEGKVDWIEQIMGCETDRIPAGCIETINGKVCKYDGENWIPLKEWYNVKDRIK